METFKEIIGVATLSLLVVLGLGVLFAGAEMWLWNQVMPELFGLREITFWQALCLSWLSTLLVKGVSSSSSKGEDHLKDITQLQRRQETLLAGIEQLQGRQVDALDEIKGSLQDIGNTLENQRWK